MEPYQIPEVKIMTLKTLVFVKNPMELEETRKNLGSDYEVFYEKTIEDIEENVRKVIIELNFPNYHLHRWESEGWVGYHIFISI